MLDNREFYYTVKASLRLLSFYTTNYRFSSSLILFCSCGSFYISEWLLTDKILMTSVSDNDENISMASLIANLTIQTLNTLLISIIIIGYNLFLYLGGLVILFRLKVISRVIKELEGTGKSIGAGSLWRRRVLIECHTIHVDVKL